MASVFVQSLRLIQWTIGFLYKILYQDCPNVPNLFIKNKLLFTMTAYSSQTLTQTMLGQLCAGTLNYGLVMIQPGIEPGSIVMPLALRVQCLRPVCHPGATHCWVLLYISQDWKFSPSSNSLDDRSGMWIACSRAVCLLKIKPYKSHSLHPKLHPIPYIVY